jgi:hypothetical protein
MGKRSWTPRDAPVVKREFEEDWGKTRRRWPGGKAMTDDLPFRVVRSNSDDEKLARCTNLPIAQAAYRAAARMYPEDLIGLRRRAGDWE